jgi:hypothetical protein
MPRAEVARGRERRGKELDIATGPETRLADNGTIGVSGWPDSADHRQIRRWVVRLLRPGLGSGSGILVGPDLVLTCRHVLQDLFGADDPGSLAAAAEVVATVGLPAAAGELSVTRYLRLAPDGHGTLTGPAWDALSESGRSNLDFALLRLDDDLGPGADWLSFQEFQSPDRLAAGAAGAAIGVFMYHFPDPADGTPYIESRLSKAQLPQDWNLADGRIAHRVASEKGSSGAMLFATVDGTRPFPIALHRGRVIGAPDKQAVALSAILQAIQTTDRQMFRQLSTPPSELRRQREVQRLAAPQVELARYLMDRDVQAKAAVGGTVARAKKVQPIFEGTSAEMALFQARLATFDLPLRHLPDPSEQQSLRCRTLAGVLATIAPEKGLPRWGIENLGGDGWLRDGSASAVRIILDRMADALALGASVLLTAQVDIQRMADYSALEDLLLALSRAMRGPEGAADALIVLWISDGEVSHRLRAQGRDVLRRLWDGRAVQPTVGVPVQLSALAQADLGPWAEDIAGAFDIRKPEIDLAIRTAWEELDRAAQAQARVARHPFEQVAQALDPPLNSWVHLHFRRNFEAARQRT